mmetsp:Transcript_143657/g.358073  ORF Transcript_143657/g.358073 Transcript_143657/m.358073 type:complete len:234 (-) Transcript_143657:32-733(-)
MTSAHRPTWHSAIASGTNPSGTAFVAQTTKVANRDAANFLSLKTRQAGQGLVEERGSRRELREELEAKEKKAREERLGTGGAQSAKDETAERQDRKERPMAAISADNPFPEDADEDLPDNSEASDASGDEDEDTEELMRELAKIKKEREAEEEAEKERQAKLDERTKRDEVMRGNPLMQGDLSLKRKWDDDTVFKNQARTAPKQKQRFINDAVRSDFHKKFLNKYVWVDGLAH